MEFVLDLVPIDLEAPDKSPMNERDVGTLKQLLTGAVYILSLYLTAEEANIGRKI